MTNIITALKQWSGSNTAWAKCTRTIFHGIVGVLIAYCAEIVTGFGFDPTTSAIITALVMAILSPIQAQLGEPAPDAATEPAYDEKPYND